MNYSNLFKPIKIGSLEIKNRYVMEPMACFGLVDENGVLSDDGIEYFARRAQGGYGLLITGTCFVSETAEELLPHTLMCCESTDLWKSMQKFNRLCDKVHSYGGKLFVQLAAGYGRYARIPTSARRGIAPSETVNLWNPSIIHHEMTIDEIHHIIERFGVVSKFFKDCGVDGVEVHAVHEGYLLDQFAMELFNHRTDEYGGSFENRYRFAMEIVRSIKESCGEDFPVSLRYSAKSYIKGEHEGAMADEEFVEKGRDLDEGIKAAKYLTQNGYYDALNVDAGECDGSYWNHPSVFQKDGLYLDVSKAVKEAVEVPVICAGIMNKPDVAINALDGGYCDMVGHARQSLADPDLPNKVVTGKIEEIRPCIGCNYGCSVRVHQESGRQSCAVNAQAARELETVLVPALEKKNIVVIGSGPAGCETAIVSALRGHNVVLLEKENSIGGALKLAAAPDFKHHAGALIKYYEHELERLNVTVKLNTPADAATVCALHPDAVVCAAGAKEIIPPIKGVEKAFLARQVLTNPSIAGNTVVILGAGQVGAETGLYLAEMGKKVHLVEIADTFMATGFPPDVIHAQALFNKYQSEIHLKTKVEEITDKGVMTENGFIDADTVILATGYYSDNKVFNEMSDSFPIVYNIGDGVKQRNVYMAVHEAYEIASHL